MGKVKERREGGKRGKGRGKEGEGRPSGGNRLILYGEGKVGRGMAEGIMDG